MQKTNLWALVALLGVLMATPLRGEAPTRGNSLFAGAEVSTLGPGFSVAWRFSDMVGVRGGVNFLYFKRDDHEINGINYDESKLRLLSAPLGVDIYPWADSPFRVTVGAMLNNNRFTAEAAQRAPGALTVMLGNSGGIDSAAIGDMRMKVDQNTVVPYIGVGYNWLLGKDQRWSIGGEVGVAYAGEPDVTLTRSNGPDAIDAQMAIEEQMLEDKFDKYTIYPIVRVTIGFRF